MSVINLMTTKHWAIRSNVLEKLAQIAIHRKDTDAINAAPGTPMKYTRTVVQRGNVAVIPVTGPLFPKASQLDTMCGAVSLEVIAQDLNTAVQNPSVAGIILDIDSPGGVAFGPAEMAELIDSYKATKPIIAYVGGMACSAAYWIAAAATEIVAHKGAMLGSIGVVTIQTKQEGIDLEGYKHIEIVSSNAQNKRPDPTTEEGLKEIMRELDAIEEVFISDVAKHRGISSEEVKAKFGQGGVFMAAEAVAIGMADRMGSFEDVLLDFQNRLTSTPKGGVMNATDKGQPQAASIAANENPIDLDAIRAEAAKAERERILAIDEITVDGMEKLAAAAKADGKTTAQELAFKWAKEQKQLGASYVSSLQTQVENNPVIDPSGNNADPAAKPTEEEQDKDLPSEARAKKQYAKSKALQDEFKTEAIYVAYCKGQESGRVRSFKGKNA